MKKGSDMDWRTFESKLLASSAYDAGTHILYLRFRTGDVYRYFEFPEQQYREFLDAESRGRYFLSHIRNQFRYEKLAKLEAARSVGVLLVVRLHSSHVSPCVKMFSVRHSAL